MTLLDGMLAGLLAALGPAALPWIVGGAGFGLAIGVIPGLSGHFALSMAVSFLYAMEPVSGVAFLIAAHSTVAQGGGLTAILFATPGTGQNAATLLDGPKMRDRGEAGVAVGAALTACFLGAAFGALALAALIPALRQAALLFGPPEIFALAVMGILFIALLGKRDMLRSLIAGLIGLLLAMVGADGVTNALRFTGGIDRLADGLPLTPVILGLFAVAEMIALWRRGGLLAGPAGPPPPVRATQAQMLRGAGLALRRWPLVIRSSAIGAGVGLIPGLGSSVAAFLAWGHARASSDAPERFGEGAVDGVIAPEAANDAVEGGALASTIAFGIPGSSSMAILLSGLMVLGVETGPAMLSDGAPLVFLMIFAIVIGNLVGSLCGMALLAPLIRLTAAPAALAVPALLAVILWGAWAGERAVFDMGLALVFGVAGYVASELRWSRAALLIGFVLGAAAERNLHLSLMLHGPSFPTVGATPWLLLAAGAFAAWRLAPSIRGRRAGAKARPAAGAGTGLAMPPRTGARTGAVAGPAPAAATGPSGKPSPERAADPAEKARLLALETVALLGVLALAALAAAEAWATGGAAARAPLAILAPLFVLGAWQLARTLAAQPPGAALAALRAAAGSPAARRPAQAVAAAAAGVAAIWLLGQAAGTVLMVLLMSWRLGGARLPHALALAAGTGGALYGLFQLWFALEPWPGLLARLLAGWRDF